jgi:hypothetical protein
MTEINDSVAHLRVQGPARPVTFEPQLFHRSPVAL